MSELSKIANGLLSKSAKFVNEKEGTETLSAGKAATVLFLSGNRFFLHRQAGNPSSQINFQDEFRALLNKHESRFEERYVWD